MRNGPVPAGPVDENGSYPVDLSVRGSLLEQGLYDAAMGLPAVGVRGAADSEALERLKKSAD